MNSQMKLVLIEVFVYAVFLLLIPFVFIGAVVYIIYAIATGKEKSSWLEKRKPESKGNTTTN